MIGVNFYLINWRLIWWWTNVKDEFSFLSSYSFGNWAPPINYFILLLNKILRQNVDPILVSWRLSTTVKIYIKKNLTLQGRLKNRGTAWNNPQVTNRYTKYACKEYALKEVECKSITSLCAWWWCCTCSWKIWKKLL